MSYKGTCIEINLNNLKNNLNYIRNKVNDQTKILCVVKANGYGSDSIEIGKCLEKNGVDYLAVAYTGQSKDDIEAQHLANKEELLKLGKYEEVTG